MIERVRQGRPLEDIFILDCHAHIGGDAQDFTIRDNTPEKILEVMDRMGIDQICISSMTAIWGDVERGNEETMAVVGRYPNRFLGYVVVNPRYPGSLLTELERYRNVPGMQMVKLHPFVHDYPVTGRKYQPVWEYCQERDVIVLSHTQGADRNCSPLMFDTVARTFPRVTILLGHMGVTHQGLDEALEVAAQHDNLYLDITSSFSPFGSIERCVREVGADRVLFGSDIPFFEQAVNFGRVAYARISDADKEKIFGLNMKQLGQRHSSTRV